MSIGSFVVSLRVFLIDNVFSVCFTCILRWFFSSNEILLLLSLEISVIFQLKLQISD